MSHRRGGLLGPYGPDGASPPRDQSAAYNARKEREERLTALVQSPEWELVIRGLNQRRQRVTATVMLGRQLEEWETRAYREQYAFLTALVQNPVAFLLEYDRANDSIQRAADELSDDKGD